MIYNEIVIAQENELEYCFCLSHKPIYGTINFHIYYDNVTVITASYIIKDNALFTIDNLFSIKKIKVDKENAIIYITFNKKIIDKNIKMNVVYYYVGRINNKIFVE